MAVNTNEGYPGLLETLQINNNKQLLPLPTEEVMSRIERRSISVDVTLVECLTVLARKNRTAHNMTVDGNNAERYFTIDTARGYILIDRE